MIELITNLDKTRAELLRNELTSLPKGLLKGSITVLDRSAPNGGESDLLPAPCPADAAPVAIEARWAWEQRRQSYCIQGEPAHPIIAGGGAEGAMYGFYQWLRDAAGRRWPYLTDIDNPAGLPPQPTPVGVVKPAIAWRGFEGTLKTWDLPFLERLMCWMLRNGWNLLLFNASQWSDCPYHDEIMQLAKQHGIRLVIGAHAVEQFLPESMFATHPEYFGLRDGQRVCHAITSFPDMPGKQSRLPVQPCFGNPEARHFLAKRIAAFIDATPGITAFSLWPHDGSNNWCECPACACDTPYRLIHQLATDILAYTQNPVPIEVLAYCNLQTPPTADLPYEPRLYTLFCPYLRNYHHRIDAPGFPEARQKLGRGWPANQPVNPVDDREYGRLFEEWLPRLRQAGSGLGVFAYYQLAFADHTGHSDRSRYLYHPDLELVAHEIRLFSRSGMGTFYDCSWPLPGLWPDARFSEVLIKLLWQPESNVAHLERAFYIDNFGDQAAAVQAMLGRINTALNLPGRPPLPPTLLDEAEATLGAVPGTAGARYRAWITYVRLADHSWQARQNGSENEACTAEAAIQTELQSQRTLLDPHLMVDWMLRTSKSLASLASKKKMKKVCLTPSHLT